jgi:hypothetical protein
MRNKKGAKLLSIVVLSLFLVSTLSVVQISPLAFAASPSTLDTGSLNRCQSTAFCVSNSKTYAAGDVLAACESQLSPGTFGIKSTPPLTWNTIASSEDGGALIGLQCWWAFTPSSQAIVVNVTSTASSNMVVLVEGFTGVNSTSPLDGSGCQGSGVTSPTACNVSTSDANDTIISVTAVSGSSVLTPTGSFADVFSDSGSPTSNMQFQVVNSPQSGLSLSTSYTKSRSYAQVGWAFAASFPLFGSTINLSNDSFAATLNDPHALAVSGSNVYATWVEPTGVGGNTQVFFAASNNNGTTWSAPMNLSSDLGPATLPKVAADGNNVYVVWRDQSTGTALVYIRVSYNAGKTFDPTFSVSNLPSIEPKVAACNGGVFVSWVNSTSRAQNQHQSAQYTMYYRGSTDGGRTGTWQSIFNLQSDDSAVANGNEEEIECSGNWVYVAYSDWSPGIRSVFLRVSNNQGQSWLPHVEIFVPTKGNIREPVLAVSGSYVHVYYIYRSTSSSPYQAFVRSSSDNGVTFPNPPFNLCSDTNSCHEAFLSASGPNVYAAIHEFVTTAKTELYFRYSNDGGVTWSSKVNLIPSETKKSTFGSISAVGSWVFVGYSNMTKSGGWEMFVTAFKNDGATMVGTYDLSNNPGSSGVFTFGNQERDVLANGNHFYSIWEDNDTPTGNIGLFFKAATFMN